MCAPKFLGVLDIDKVHISEKATKFCENLHQLFVLCTASQIIGGDFENFVAFSEYMNFKELKYERLSETLKS